MSFRRTPTLRFTALFIAVIAFAALVYAAYFVGLFPGGRSFVRPWDVYVFAGVDGPNGSTIIEPAHDDWEIYAEGTTSRLAIWLTTPDSNWRGLAHGLKSLGVPFIVTDDWRRAIRHRVVMAYPLVSGRGISPEALQEIAAIPRRGGTLIGVSVLGGGLNEVFGFDSVEPSLNHTRLSFDGKHPLTGNFADRTEWTVSIGSELFDQKLSGQKYLGTSNPALATYEDGGAAITWKDYASGHAYAFGFDPGDFTLKAHNRRLGLTAPTYANGYVSTVDVILRLIRSIYRQGEPRAVTLAPVPEGKDLAVMLSHDIDYSHSLKNAVDYAMLEMEQGTPATHLIQTKYIRDWNDEIFFNDENMPYLKKIHELGGEIASHSVSHARTFDKFPLGTGEERYPDYRPFVESQYVALNATIFGELRVSRFLLEEFSGQDRVETFRPGHLSYPELLPQALHATGYRYSSSVTANVSLTHLPFRMNFDRGPNHAVPVFEFPVTVEDELAPNLPDRLEDAIELAQHIARHGGIYVVLIHTDTKGRKLEFQRALVNELTRFSWFGTISEFGRWWSTRDMVEVDVRHFENGIEVTLEVPRAIESLVLETPPNMKILAADVDVKALGSHGNRFVLGALSGRANMRFVRVQD